MTLKNVICYLLSMDTVFIVKLILSFITGSVWITAGTVLAERYGTKIGGLIAGLPSTILISLFFIGWTQSEATAVAATTIVPIIGGINCLFILTYILLIKVHFIIAIGGALSIWFVLSTGLVIMGFNNFLLSVLAYCVLLVVSHYIVEHRLRIPSEPGRNIQYTPVAIVMRALFSGAVISLAVICAKVGGPILGGVFAMFPAMFVGTIFITYCTRGALFSAAVMKSSILGAISVVIYGIATRYTYLPFGLIGGTFISMAISCGSSLCIHGFIKKMTT